MLDWQGRIAETTGANIFLVIDGRLVTPTPHNFLDGITRRAVMGMAKKRGWTVEERDVMPEELGSASEVFLCGSAAEIVPVGSIDQHHFQAGPVAKTLMADFQKLVREPDSEGFGEATHLMTAGFVAGGLTGALRLVDGGEEHGFPCVGPQGPAAGGEPAADAAMGDAFAQLVASPQMADPRRGSVGQVGLGADRVFAVGIVGFGDEADLGPERSIADPLEIARNGDKGLGVGGGGGGGGGANRRRGRGRENGRARGEGRGEAGETATRRSQATSSTISADGGGDGLEERADGRNSLASHE